MSRVIYDNDNAVLTFEYGEVTKCLSGVISEHEIEDASELLTWLIGQSQDDGNDIELRHLSWEKSGCVGPLVHCLIDLLVDGKRDIFCKSCKQQVPNSKIKVTKDDNKDPQENNRR